MGIEHLGKTAIRRGDYQEPRWDLFLSENHEAIAAMLETLVTGYRWVSGFTLTETGGLGFDIVDGIINKSGVDTPITGGSFTVQDGTTQYVYVNSGDAIQVGNTFDTTGIFPLYMIQASGGAITSIGDMRNLQTASPGGGGGLTWVETKTADFNVANGEGYPIDSSSGIVTATCPSDPSPGDTFAIKDYQNFFNVISAKVDPNGKKIEGLEGVMEFTARGYSGEFTFIDDDRGWLITYNTPMDLGVNFARPSMQAQWRMPAGSNGGARSGANKYDQLPLNTVRFNTIEGASLLGDGFVSLPAGEYYINANEASRAAAGHYVRTIIRDRAGNNLLEGGSTTYTDADHAWKGVRGLIALTIATDIEVTSISNNTCTGDDCLGEGSNIGGMDEVFCDITISKVDTVIKKTTIADPDMYLKKPLFYFRHREPAGTDGGPTSIGRNEVPLNTVVTNEIPGLTVNGSRIFLPAGTFTVSGYVPGHQVETNDSRLRIRKVSDDSILLSGPNVRRGGANATGAMHTEVFGRITLAETTEVFLDLLCAVATATYGLGYRYAGSTSEIYENYGEIKIWQEDALVEAPKVYRPVQEPISGAVVTGNIYGGELEYIDETIVRVKPFSAMSDDHLVGLAVNQNIDLDITSLITAATTYHAWAVRRSNGSMWAEIGTDPNGADLSGDVVQKRWLGFYRIDVTGAIRQWTQKENHIDFVSPVSLGISSGETYYSTDSWLPRMKTQNVYLKGDTTGSNVYLARPNDGITRGDIIASAQSGGTGASRTNETFNTHDFFAGVNTGNIETFITSCELLR